MRPGDLIILGFVLFSGSQVEEIRDGRVTGSVMFARVLSLLVAVAGGLWLFLSLMPKR